MVRLDPDARKVHGPRGSASVTDTEYRLLRALLMAGFGVPVRHTILVDKVWPICRPTSGSGSLKTAINRLRPALWQVGGCAIVAVYPGAYKIEAIPTRVPLVRAA